MSTVTRVEGPVGARPDLIRIGTRGSALAISQTTTVAEAIAAATGIDVVLVTVKTEGDVSRQSLSQLGGTGVFVSALRDALIGDRCDIAVHSLKDLPTAPCQGIALGAIPVRADARDALCARDGQTLADLPHGASVGTGSPRRAAQLLCARPDLNVRDLRGNVDTRLRRVENDLDAVVLAAAGLDRIGRSSAITERFALDRTPGAPGQGALALEVRESDLARDPYATAFAALNDSEARASALAERELLAALEAGCAAPVGATARIAGDRLLLSATVYRLDGAESLTASADCQLPDGTDGAHPGGTASDAAAVDLGRRVAVDLLERGAASLAPLGSAR